MAIVPSDEYPGRTVAPSADYPQGSAQNESVPGANDGTPFESAGLNDQYGFLQALLEAGSITPSGDPDTAANSQYRQGVEALITAAINALNLAQQIQDGAEDVFDDKVAEPDAALAALIDSRSEDVFDAEVADPDAALVSLIDSRVPGFTEGSYTDGSPGVAWLESINVRITKVNRMVMARVRLSTNDAADSGSFTWSGAVADSTLRPQVAIGSTYATGAPESDESLSDITAEINSDGDVIIRRRSGQDAGAYVFNMVWPLSGFPTPS